jgi:hypothetical protein
MGSEWREDTVRKDWGGHLAHVRAFRSPGFNSGYGEPLQDLIRSFKGMVLVALLRTDSLRRVLPVFRREMTLAQTRMVADSIGHKKCLILDMF